MRRLASLLAMSMASLALAACAPSMQTLGICDDSIESATVSHTYADHDSAERVVLDDPAAVCEVLLPFDALEAREFDDEDLWQRTTTVIEFVDAAGTAHTVWASQLPTSPTSTAILFDDGRSFWLPHRLDSYGVRGDHHWIERREVRLP